jgi:hypothetical protein
MCVDSKQVAADSGAQRTPAKSNDKLLQAMAVLLTVKGPRHTMKWTQEERGDKEPKGGAYDEVLDGGWPDACCR